MKEKNNTLLVEIMIAVLFFALASTVILETFVTAHRQSGMAEACDRAVAAAQNVADRIYAADTEAEKELETAGFTQQEDGSWLLPATGYALSVRLGTQGNLTGTLRTATVRALYADEREIVTLPVSWYIPQEVAP